MPSHLTPSELKNIVTLSKALNSQYPPSDIGLEIGTEKAQASKSYRTDMIPLNQAITALSLDARAELAALMYIGRDAVSNSNGNGTFSECYHDQISSASLNQPEYISEKSPSLPLYFKEAVRKMGLGQQWILAVA